MTNVTKQHAAAVTGAGNGLGRDIALGLAAGPRVTVFRIPQEAVKIRKIIKDPGKLLY